MRRCSQAALRPPCAARRWAWICLLARASVSEFRRHLRCRCPRAPRPGFRYRRSPRRSAVRGVEQLARRDLPRRRERLPRALSGAVDIGQPGRRWRTRQRVRPHPGPRPGRRRGSVRIERGASGAFAVGVLGGAPSGRPYGRRSRIPRRLPAFSQRYSGWKSEIAVSPNQWLPGPGTLRWQPALRLYAQRTRTAGPATLELVQHDRAGVLSFTSSADVSGLPAAYMASAPP